MRFTILTLFPHIFDSPLQEGLLRKAKDRGLIEFEIVNIRDFSDDPHRSCDDYPYGGGPGMIMRIEPIYKAMKHLEEGALRPYYVLLTPQGRVLDQDLVRKFSKMEHLCLICGRYEGIDERILRFVDDEVSIGNYILSGGEFAALVLIDAVSRLIPHVLGNERSAMEDSLNEFLLEYPQYTRPRVFLDMEVPAVLLSGNHEEIKRWRRKESIRKTLLKRPDLMEKFEAKDEQDSRFIREILEEISG